MGLAKVGLDEQRLNFSFSIWLLCKVRLTEFYCPTFAKPKTVSCKMRVTTLFILVSQLFVACAFNGKGDSILPTQFDTLQVPTNEEKYYFQLKTSSYDSTNNAVDTLRNKWFSHFLFHMKEPIINDYKGNMEVYRFTWLRTFHHPVVLRLEKMNDSVRLISKMTNGAGGYFPGTMIMDTINSVSLEKYDSLIYEIETANFWLLPTAQRRSGNDGSEWIVEAYMNGEYHLVYRWSPTPETKPTLSDIGKFLIRLSPLPEESKELY